jgi:hypothetical protein
VCKEVVAISGRAYVFNVVRSGGGGIDATNMFGVFGWTPSVSDWLMHSALGKPRPVGSTCTVTCGFDHSPLDYLKDYILLG